MQSHQFCSVSWAEKALFAYTPAGLTRQELRRDKAKGDKNDYDATARAIAELGFEGWQLASVATGADLTSQVFYFQRSIP